MIFVEVPVEEAVMVAKATRLDRLASNPEVASEIQLVPGIETMEPGPDAEADSAQSPRQF